MTLLAQTVKLFLVLWISVSSLINFRWLSDPVFCFGRDGHVAIEQSADGDYCLPSENGSDAHLTVGSIDDHCGQCMDVRTSVLSSSIQMPKKGFRFQTVQLQMLAYFHPAFVPFSLFLKPDSFPDNPPIRKTTLVSLRSVVLLI